MNLVLFESGELVGAARGSLSLRDARAVHLIKVLRKKPGDVFDAGIIGGKIGTGLVENTAAALCFSLDLGMDPPPRTPVRLVVGFPRPIQLRRLLRDCAALGLAAVDIAGADLGEKSYLGTNLLRGGGARVAFVEGAAQARDTQLPELAVYPSLDAWLKSGGAHSPPDTWLLAADNVRPAGGFSGLDRKGRKSRAVLAVGPERGWSDRERTLLEDAGFFRLSIGKRALRTETACVAAAVLVMEKLGLL
jgi:RsmE family RNA methyltransferase